MKDNYRTDLHTILKNGKYYIPTLQRNYEWENENIEELWCDLFTDELWQNGIDKIDRHFMGTVVTCPRRVEGKVVTHGASDVEVLDILDGQQRLTTLSIFLGECFIKMNQEIDNYDHLGNVRNSIFINRSRKEKTELRLNLQPSLDKEIYEYHTSKLIESKPSDLSIKNLKSKFQFRFPYIRIGKNKLLNCINTTKRLLEDTIKEAKEHGFSEREILDSIADRLLYKTDFLIINTSSATSAYKIFESLNNRGVELSQADLIKNKLCSLLEEIELNDFAEKWNMIKSDVSTESNGTVNYLRSYMISKRGIVRKDDLLDEYENEIGLNVLDDRKKIKKNLDKLINNLTSHASKFAMLTSPEDSPVPENCKEWASKVSFLNKLQAKTCRHALLSALIYDFPEINKLVDIITVLQLRIVIDDGNPNKAEKMHCQVAKLIGDSNGEISFSEIEKMYTSLITSNEDFFHKFMDVEAKSIPAWRYILEKYHEKEFGTEIKISDAKVVHVEHILAKNACRESLEESGVTKEELPQFAHKPGNLTLIDATLNIKAQNDKFSHKNKEYYASSKLPMNTYFKKLRTWTKNDIDERTSIICQAISEIWMHPKEGAITDSQIKNYFKDYRNKVSE